MVASPIEMMVLAGTHLFSRASIASRAERGRRGERAARGESDDVRNHMRVSFRGPRRGGKASDRARGPGARAVPGRRGAHLAVRTPPAAIDVWSAVSRRRI